MIHIGGEDDPVFFAPFKPDTREIKRHLIAEALQPRGPGGKLVERAAAAVEYEVHGVERGADAEVDVLAFERTLKRLQASKQVLHEADLQAKIVFHPPAP